MVGSRSLHYSSFASYKKKHGPTDSGINLTLLFQQQKNISIQYNGGLLPDIILLTQINYHRGTRLNAMKRFCICSLWFHLNVLTFFPLDWGMLRRSRRVLIFLLNNSKIFLLNNSKIFLS